MRLGTSAHLANAAGGSPLAVVRRDGEEDSATGTTRARSNSESSSAPSSPRPDLSPACENDDDEEEDDEIGHVKVPEAEQQPQQKKEESEEEEEDEEEEEEEEDDDEQTNGETNTQEGSTSQGGAEESSAMTEDDEYTGSTAFDDEEGEDTSDALMSLDDDDDYDDDGDACLDGADGLDAGSENEEEDDDVEERTLFNNRLERFVEPGDAIQQMVRCEVAEAMDTRKGVLLVCARNVYVVRDFTLTAEGEVQDVADDARGQATGFEHHDSHTCLKWSRADVREVIRRRYLLRWVALEVFLGDGHSHLLVFEPDDVEPARRTLKAIADATPFFSTARMLVDASQLPADGTTATTVGSVIGSGTSTSSSVIGGGGVGGGASTALSLAASTAFPLRRLALQVAGSSSSGGPSSAELAEATQQWVEGRMSNFQYLMYLNTAAGRSYNDITQYPVFPWVLRDYTSATLDLADPAVYRDLSKPIGALDPARAAFFRERYAQCLGVVAPHHYSHHYSSAAVVVYYLLRVEPFTKPFLDLNGGHWDWPDRLFHSVEETWATLTQGTMPQVMELTPEFFYLPEFLENRNRFAFGTAESDGRRIDGVELPPWAHGSARAFVRANLQALESPHVSAHLNEWIDLIFGYKQRGQAAVDAVNVFNQHSYEGAVDVDAITDEVERASTIATIREFGQTPQQLWDKYPHPRRAQAALHPPLPPTWSASPALVAPTVVLRLSSGSSGAGSSSSSSSAAAISAILLPPGQSAERPPSALCRAVFVSFAQPQRHAVYGYTDRSVRIFNGDKLQNVWYPRCTAVTCAASSGDGSCLVFGAADSTVRVFTPDTSGSGSSSSSGSGSGSSSSKRGATLETVLCGHTKPVSCIAVSRNHSLIVSGATDGTLVFWDLNRHVLVHEVLVAWRSTFARLRHRATAAETPVVAADIHIITGNVAACTRRRVTLWSVNAQLLAAVTLSEQGAHLPAAALVAAPVAPDISCCLFSQEWIPGTGQVLLTGHVDGSIRVWDVDSVEGAPVPPASTAFSSDGCVCPTDPPDESVLPVITLKHILYTGENSAVTALYVPFTDKTRLFAGTASGVVVQIADVMATKKR